MFKPITFVFLGVAFALQSPHILAAPTDSPPATTTASAEAPSLTAHLQLSDEQIERLNRLYDGYAWDRARRETKIAAARDQLEEAQAPDALGQRRASRLLREIGATRQKMVDNLVSTRSKAFKILSPVERSQLESLATNDRIRVRFDRYHELFLLPIEEIAQASIEDQDENRTAQKTARRDGRQNRRRGTTRYDVYGGYSYGGPNYGVVGSYNEGPFGAHVGVGRGGPFLGVGIGGILSGRR